MGTLWGWALALVVCCAPARSDDSFANKISRACKTEEGCRTVRYEAELRAVQCRTQPECSEFRSDLSAANAQLNARVRERESEEARKQAEHLVREKEARNTHDRELAEYAEKRQQQRDTRDREKQEAKEREAAHLRFLGPEGRRRELVNCYEQHAPIECSDTVARLLASTSGNPERRSLIALNEKTMQRWFDTAREPIVGQILCCDGTISESCVCGAKLKNCCPRRGGVCGCTKAPMPNAQPTGE